MDTDVVAALRRIPLFEGVSEADMSAERLGGLTNRNYRIDGPAGRFVLRLAGEGTAEYIDRAVEEHNARVAAGAGVNAEVLFFDTADGTMLCRYIDDSVTMDAQKFKDPKCESAKLGSSAAPRTLTGSIPAAWASSSGK